MMLAAIKCNCEPRVCTFHVCQYWNRFSPLLGRNLNSPWNKPSSPNHILIPSCTLFLSGWTPVVQSCAESFDWDYKWWKAWHCDHSRLHRPHQDLAGSDWPGGGILFYCIATLHITAVQYRQQLVPDCALPQTGFRLGHSKVLKVCLDILSSRLEPVRDLCVHWLIQLWPKSQA